VQPGSHIATSTVVSALLYGATHSVPLTVSSFLAGFLIDIDHAFDFVREHGITFDVRKFFHLFNEVRFRKLTFVLHSWELVLLVLAFSMINGIHEGLLGVAIGMTHHLVTDQFINRVRAGGYFFTFRLYHRFAVSAIFRRKMQRPRTAAPPP
jgi:hypothetical protein